MSIRWISRTRPKRSRRDVDDQYVTFVPRSEWRPSGVPAPSSFPAPDPATRQDPPIGAIVGRRLR